MTMTGFGGVSLVRAADRGDNSELALVCMRSFDGKWFVQ